MSKQTLLERIAQLPRDVPGEHVPPPELVAFTIAIARGLRNWKQSTLADFAGVSISTVERVERGERVRHSALEKIGQALGYHAGYFTAPREQISNKEAEAIAQEWGSLVPVEVSTITTQPQIRRLVQTHGLIIHCPGCEEEIEPDIRSLAEWLDLGSFLFSKLLPPEPKEVDGRKREFYRGVFEAVRQIETQGYTVLAGITTTTVMGIEDWRVAVVSVTPKKSDPGAPKRRLVLVDKRCWASPLESRGFLHQ
ncbi:MAG: helix-turn-helix domain-containing protein [Caulobacter sp.]